MTRRWPDKPAPETPAARAIRLTIKPQELRHPLPAEAVNEWLASLPPLPLWGEGLEKAWRT